MEIFVAADGHTQGCCPQNFLLSCDVKRVECTSASASRLGSSQANLPETSPKTGEALQNTSLISNHNLQRQMHEFKLVKQRQQEQQKREQQQHQIT